MILDLVFPKVCLGCGNEGRYLCPFCMEKSERTQPVCPYCKHPSIGGATHFNCREQFGLDGLTSIWKYKGIIRKAVTSFKYKYATEVGKEISGYITSSLDGVVLPSLHSLVPIPIYWYKENVRGFNQSIELGGNIAEKLRLKFMPNLLIKQLATTPQAVLSYEARRKNLKGAFILNSDYQIPESVLLFDDVFTTGSTMFEITKMLKKAGTKMIWGLTVAR